jgi:hypothetical protein
MNLSSLANPITFNASVEGVNARIQLTPTRTREDSDGDGISDYREEQTWITSSGPLNFFSTDPYDNDTDDDGLTDGQEVTISPYGITNDGSCEEYVDRPSGVVCGGEERPFRAVTTSDPTRYDTDGDGLADYVESRFNEGREIQAALDPDSAEKYSQAVQKEEQNADRHLSTISVSSSALKQDSDNDGVPDQIEDAYGLDPSDSDTDTDGITDETEIEKETYPTLHDFQPPRFTGSIDTEDHRKQYRARVEAQDPSGVGDIVLKVRDKTASTHSGAQDTTSWTPWISAERSWPDLFGTWASGMVNPSSATVEVSDVHGNSREKTLLGPNTWGSAADNIRGGGIIEAGGRTFYGFTSGVANTAYSLKEGAISGVEVIAGGPDAWGEAATNTVRAGEALVEIAQDSKKRSKAFSAMVQHYGYRRSQLNPFEHGDNEDAFALAFSAGDLSTWVMPWFAGPKVAAKASQVRYIGALMKAGETARYTAKGMLAGRALKTGGKIAQKVDADLDYRNTRVRNIDPSDRADAIVAGSMDALRKTPIPAQRRIQRLIEPDSETTQWLTSAGKTRVRNGLMYLRRTGEPGRRLLSSVSDATKTKITRMRDNAAMQRRLVEAYDAGDLSRADVGRVLRRYENTDRRAEFDDLIQREGPDAIAVSGKVSDETFDAIIRADISTDRKAARLDSISEMEETSLFEGLRSITPGSQAFRLARNLPGDGARLERLLRKLDFRPKRILAAGSGDLDASFDRAIARAETDETVDADQLNGALKQVDDLSGAQKRRAKELIAETDGAGVTFAADLDGETLQSVLDTSDPSIDDTVRAIRRYDEMEASEQAAFREVAQTTDRDALDVLANSGGPARRVMTDGGVDTSFREAVADAANSDAIDSFDQLDDAVRKIDDLDGEANLRARELIDETDGVGLKFVDEFETTQLRTVMDAVESTDGLVRLSRQFDAGTVDSRHLDEITDLLNSGDMDGADVRRFSEMLDRKDSDPLIDDSIDANDLLARAQKSDLSNSLGIVQRGSKISILPDGDSDTGWTHIKSRHIDGTYKIDQKDSTSFFPVGQKVKGKKLSTKLSESDVKRMVLDTIKYGDEAVTGSRAKYYFEPTSNGYPNSGVDGMRVVVEEGTVKTAFPLSGDSVYKWVPELNNGNGGFVSP